MQEDGASVIPRSISHHLGSSLGLPARGPPRHYVSRCFVSGFLGREKLQHWGSLSSLPCPPPRLRGLGAPLPCCVVTCAAAQE